MRKLVAALALLAAPAGAKPLAPAELCRVYADAPGCRRGAVECSLCHTNPPARNVFGAQVAAALLPDTPRPLDDATYLAALPDALRTVEMLDADGDGATNLEELLAGSHPADRDSIPVYDECAEDDVERAAAPMNRWNVCGYDPLYAFRKVHLDFCGASPDREAAATFASLGDGWQAGLLAALEGCLDSDHWQGVDGVVWSLAHAKIRPIASIKGGANAGGIPLGDYDDDYNLFVYAHTDDRDVREVLTAQYFVHRQPRPDGPDELRTFARGPIADFNQRGFGSAQVTEVEDRAGMLTTRWFLISNTMFTAIPRTTAAQAYRAYLGYDISRMEGLQDVAGEPVDYDDKGVQDPECAGCHATLDPLTYPFTRYDGLGGGRGALGGPGGFDTGNIIGPDGRLNLPFASYTANRLTRFPEIDGPHVAAAPEAGVLLGQPVANLLEWAQVAADSEDFARKVVRDYWELLMGEPPRASEAAEFDRLWQNLMTTHAYRVEQMLRDLVLTEAYGVP